MTLHLINRYSMRVIYQSLLVVSSRSTDMSRMNKYIFKLHLGILFSQRYLTAMNFRVLVYFHTFMSPVEHI